MKIWGVWRPILTLAGGVMGSMVSVMAFAGITQTTTLTATVVASSCVGEIITPTQTGRAEGQSGTVDFGVINPKARSAPVRFFSLRLSEFAGGDTGCSAFEAYGRQYPVATLTFGDVGQRQLDENGVILRYDDGSDAQLRVQVSPQDAEGIFVQSGAPGYITSTYTDVAYPIAFATKGLFGFQAALSQWAQVKSGRFSGSLTVTVAYR